VAFRQSPWNHYGCSSGKTQVAIRSPYLDNDFVKRYTRTRPATDIALNDKSALAADSRRKPGVAEFSLLIAASRPQQRVHALVLEFFFKAEYAYDMACRSGWQRSTMYSPRFSSERIWLAATSPSTSAFGTGIN